MQMERARFKKLEPKDLLSVLSFCGSERGNICPPGQLWLLTAWRWTKWKLKYIEYMPPVACWTMEQFSNVNAWNIFQMSTLYSTKLIPSSANLLMIYTVIHLLGIWTMDISIQFSISNLYSTLKTLTFNTLLVDGITLRSTSTHADKWVLQGHQHLYSICIQSGCKDTLDG